MPRRMSRAAGGVKNYQFMPPFQSQDIKKLTESFFKGEAQDNLELERPRFGP